MMTFGSDPEFFVVRDGRPVSAIGIVEGDIEHRINIKGHEFYYDNVLAECAIKPGSTKSEVLQNFAECIKIYSEMVWPHKLETRASHEFTDTELAHDGARKVGCSPDMCAYEVAQKVPPIYEIENGNLRSSGGHVHVGADVLISNGPEPAFCVFMWDLLLGVTSLHLDKDPSAKVRRTLYGQPGRYRTKPYGLEYRTLSSFWLRSPRLVGLIYDLTQLVIDIVESGQINRFWKFDLDVFYNTTNLADAYVCIGYDAKALKKGINESDKRLTDDHYKLARSLIPPPLLNELDQCIDIEWKDLNTEWGIG